MLRTFLDLLYSGLRVCAFKTDEEKLDAKIKIRGKIIKYLKAEILLARIKIFYAPV